MYEKCIFSEFDWYLFNLFFVKGNGGFRGFYDVEGWGGSVGVDVVFIFKKVEVIGF